MLCYKSIRCAAACLHGKSVQNETKLCVGPQLQVLQEQQHAMQALLS